MTPAEFSKRRERIEHAPKRSDQWRKKAMRSLVREARAVVVVMSNHPIGWQMLDGRIVCSKRRYKNLREAELHLQIINAFGTGDVKPRRAYFCPQCHGYHLTKRE